MGLVNHNERLISLECRNLAKRIWTKDIIIGNLMFMGDLIFTDDHVIWVGYIREIVV